jgi:hypothetical protein
MMFLSRSSIMPTALSNALADVKRKEEITKEEITLEKWVKVIYGATQAKTAGACHHQGRNGLPFT